MGIEVFNRVEKKFLIDQETYEKLKFYLMDKLEEDAYNEAHGFYTISNIYYDTPHSDLIRRSLEKPMYKEKLRLRAYGVPTAEDFVYLEIKKKFDGIVNKRRSHMKLDEAYDFVSSKQLPEAKPYHNKQVLKEIDFMLDRYDLSPSTYIAYDRHALFKDDLRITFDTNIRSRHTDLFLEAGDHGDLLLPEGQWLMEVKAGHSLPLWLARELSELKIFSSSFSKYGKVFTRFMEDHSDDHDLYYKEKGETILCLNPYLVAQHLQRQPSR